MSSRTKCPVCDAAVEQTLLFFDKYPYFTVPVSISDKNEILEKYTPEQLTATLEVKTCMNCCHCFLATCPDHEVLNSLYLQYYTYPSPLEGIFHPERDRQFLEYFEKNVEPLCRKMRLKSVFEVGCYDGYILYHIKQKGFIVTGCDPSKGAEIGNKFGVNIIRQFFDSKKFLKNNQSFDVVVSRHFIEHVVDPIEWIRNLKEVLNPGGILVLETPNAQFYLERGLVEVFSLQHIHVFSAASIDYALRESEMKVCSIDKNSNNLIAIAESGNADTDFKIEGLDGIVTNFNEKVAKGKSKLKEMVSEFSSGYKIIGMWGAGGFGLAAVTLYEISAQYVNFYIDADSNKWDMEYMDTSIPIISPEKAKLLNPDLIIVTSMYSRSILKQIREIGLKSSVLTIFPDITLNPS